MKSVFIIFFSLLIVLVATTFLIIVSFGHTEKTEWIIYIINILILPIVAFIVAKILKKCNSTKFNINCYCEESRLWRDKLQRRSYYPENKSRDNPVNIRRPIGNEIATLAKSNLASLAMTLSSKSLFAFLLITFVLITFFISQKQINIEHYSFYLGPVWDLLHGKSIFTQTPSQYGYLSIFFFATLLKTIGVSFTTFHLSNTIFYLIYMFFIFFILKNIIKNLFLVFLLALIIASLQTVYSDYSNILHPSTMFPRFGLGLVIMYLLSKNQLKLIRIIGGIITAIAIFWSIETAVYIVPAWVGAWIIYEYAHQSSWKLRFIKLINDLLPFTMTFLISFLIFIFNEFVRKNLLINLTSYYQYAQVYQNGFGALPIPLFGNYYYFVGAMLLGVALLCYLIINKIKTRYLLLLSFINIHNIAIFSYFISRSHENNIVNIALFAILQLVVIVGVLIELFGKKDRILRIFSFFLSILTILYLFNTGQKTILKYDFMRTSLINNFFLWTAPAQNQNDLKIFLSSYQRTKTPIALLSVKDTEILTSNNIVNALPLNPWVMTSILPINLQENYLQPAIASLKPESLLITDSKLTVPYLIRIKNRINEKFNLKLIKQIPRENLKIYQLL